MPRMRNLCILLFTLLTASAMTVQALDIDSFTDAFPINPDLPLSGGMFVFSGTRCDGGACPPNPILNHLTSDLAVQAGLAGVLGGNREGEIYYVAGSANAIIAPSLPGLAFNHNAGASARLELRYGMAADMNADITILSSTALRVRVLGGDMTAGPRPVPCTITVTSGRGTGSEATASSSQDLIADGSYLYPYMDFVGVDFTDVDRIVYEFDASLVTAVDFAIGPLDTNGGTVAVEEQSWGLVKKLWK